MLPSSHEAPAPGPLGCCGPGHDPGHVPVAPAQDLDQADSSSEDSDSDASSQDHEKGLEKGSSLVDRDILDALRSPKSLLDTELSVGNVRMKNSSHVDFRMGNNTYFQGPVTVLKQILVSPPGPDFESKCKEETYSHSCDSSIKTDHVAPTPVGAASPPVVSPAIEAPSLQLPLDKRLYLRCRSFPCLGAVLACLVAASTLVVLVVTKMSPVPKVPDPTHVPEGQVPGFRPPDNPPDLLPPRVLTIVPRKEWLAQPPTSLVSKLHTPVQYILINHSASDFCPTIALCARMVRYIQQNHVEGNGWSDIGYNFLVGGDGSAYEGRGWDRVGAHTLGWNNISIGICFIGTFITERAPERQQQAALRLAELGVKLGKVHPDYRIIAQMQVKRTESPGRALFADMKKWPHWYNYSSD